MKDKISNVIGIVILGGLLVLLSGAAGEPLAVGNDSAIQLEASLP